MQFKMKTYPTDRVLALAFAAYRENNGYVKQSSTTDNGVRTWANKEIVSWTLSAQENSKNWAPDGFVGLTVTDEDFKKVEETKKYVKRYTLNLISGNINSFQKDVFDSVMSEELPVNKIAILCYVPEFVDRELMHKEYVKRIKTDYENSKHYDSTVSGVCEILKSLYIKGYEMYLLIGGIDGNLVSFTNNEDKYKVGEKYNITAKSKRKDSCNDTGLPQTRLSYVKVKKNVKANKT